MRIFTTPSTFHGTSIGNHDLKIVDNMDIEHGLLINVVMNKIVDVSTVDSYDDFPMLDISN